MSNIINIGNNSFLAKYILCTFFVISILLHYNKTFAYDICETYEDILNSKIGDNPIPYNEKIFVDIVKYYGINFDNYYNNYNNESHKLYDIIEDNMNRCFYNKHSLKSGYFWDNRTTLTPKNIQRYIEFMYILLKYKSDDIKENQLCSLFKSIALKEKSDLSIEDMNIIYSIYGNDIFDKAYGSGFPIVKAMIKISMSLKEKVCLNEIGFKSNGNVYTKGNEVIYSPLNLVVDKLEYEYNKSMKREQEKQRELQEAERIMKEKEIEKQKLEKMNKICKKIVKEYNLTEEESTFLIPSGGTFGEFICDANLGGVIVDFAKQGLFTKEYKLIVSNDDKTTSEFKFFKPKDQDFIDDGEKALKTNKVILNYTVKENKKFYQPKTYSEASAILSLYSAALKFKSMMRGALLDIF